MADLSSLTRFQRSGLRELQSIISENGSPARKIEMAGEKENYLVVRFDVPHHGPVSVWLYQDECMLSVENVSFHFEKPDFTAPGTMLAALIDTVSRLFKGQQPLIEKQGWAGLFYGKKL